MYSGGTDVPNMWTLSHVSHVSHVYSPTSFGQGGYEGTEGGKGGRVSVGATLVPFLYRIGTMLPLPHTSPLSH